jgi:hypothetical protein
MSTPTVRLAPAKRGGQPEAVGQFPQQRRAGVPDHAGPSMVTSKPPGELVACTRKVPSLSR